MNLINIEKITKVFAERKIFDQASFFLQEGEKAVSYTHLMNNGGIAVRLVNVAKVLSGRMPGALAQSNVVANMMFGAISGSGAAAAAAIGGTMGPLEEQEGYDKVFSTAVNIASAPTGMLIPPSNLMIVYSTVDVYKRQIAMDVIVAGYQIEQREDGDNYVILEETLAAEEYGIGFKKGNEALRDKVQTTLEEMAADGTMAEISNKWFGRDVTVIGK